jgi:hypothetical protein
VLNQEWHDAVNLLKKGNPDQIVSTAKVKVNIQFTVEQATKAHEGIRSITLLFL